MPSHDIPDLADKQPKLDAFLVDNPELEQLNARLATFNLFRVLRIEKAEIRHSNVLAWLLTPDGTHGLGATFLRRFLSRLLMENDVAEVGLTPAQVELMSFGDVEVLREWQSIDVLARSRAENWCLLIENKIGSKEKKGALARYKESVKADMPSAQVVPVLLTMEGEDPSEEGMEAGFIPLSHLQVLELADQIVEQNRARIPADASAFLGHYLETLRRLTMQDEEIIELCKTIYRKHREAVDMIVEFGGASQIMDACEQELTTLVECEFVKNAHGSLWFLPSVMGKHEPTVALRPGWQFLPRQIPVVCWVMYDKKHGKLHALMEVGPLTDSAGRLRLMHSIKDAGFKFNEKNAFKEGAKFTRIVSKIRKLRVDEDGEPDQNPDYIREVVRSLWKQLWDEGSKITDVLKGFDWGNAEEK